MRGCKRTAAVVLTLTVTGCAAGQMSPRSERADPSSLSDIDTLERQLLSEEQALDRHLGGPRPETTTVAPAVDAAGGEPDLDAEPPPPAPSPTDAEGASYDRGESACDVACRALESMRRVTARICALDGASGARCVRAEDRVAGAEERIREASCPCAS